MTINGTAMSMVRGDSESFSVTCSTPFASGDTLYFTVRKAVDAPIALQMVVTDFDENGKAVFPIDPTDTTGLAYGQYVYDIQVNWASGAVKTLIEKSPFILREEVTYCWPRPSPSTGPPRSKSP